jgi:hypothetical protein
VVFALWRLQQAFVPSATSSEKIAAKFWLTWQKGGLKSGPSLARAVLFDIVEKRKGCAGGGAVSVLFCTRITKEIDYLSIPNRCKTYVMGPGDLSEGFDPKTRLT